jgi:hypothetical protein
MKTKLEINFSKQSEPFLIQLKKAEMDYEKFLRDFIMNEIIGEENCDEYLNEKISCLCDFDDWTFDELIEEFVSEKYILELLIKVEIIKLKYVECSDERNML